MGMGKTWEAAETEKLLTVWVQESEDPIVGRDHTGKTFNAVVR